MEQLYLSRTHLLNPLRADSTVELHTSLQLNPSDLNLIVAFPTNFHHNPQHEDPPPDQKDIPQYEDPPPTTENDETDVKTEPLSPFTCSCPQVKTEPSDIDLDNNLEIKVEPVRAPHIKTEPLESEPDIETEPVFPESEPLPDNQQTAEAVPPATAALTIAKVRQNQLAQLLDYKPLIENPALPAYYLFQKQDWQELYHYLSNREFPPEYHPRLQELWFNGHYEEYRSSRGISTLSPHQKYRIRSRNPLPLSLSSIKFRSNNNFSSRVRALLNKYFQKSPYVSSSDLEVLCEKTELSSQQIKNYFKNKRTRTKWEFFDCLLGKLYLLKYQYYFRQYL